MNTDVSSLVRQLVDAENERARSKADSILAQNFTAITRSSGKERERSILLDEIEKPAKPNLHRIIEELSPLTSDDLAVVRSLVTTTDKTDPQAATGKFRNIHVFENQDGHWRCVAWQVTELK